ncbi:hypothetical protein D3C80_1788910 [compost metagenome]
MPGTANDAVTHHPTSQRLVGMRTEILKREQLLALPTQEDSSIPMTHDPLAILGQISKRQNIDKVVDAH